MIFNKEELFTVLKQYNPWWGGGQFPELPSWRRPAFQEILKWTQNPPARRALLLSGARQIGKTTLFLQVIRQLLDQGTSPDNILYATFDHPLLKLAGIEPLLQLWREYEPPGSGPEYLFIDEIQSVSDWQVWVKHQVDFNKNRRLALTGSAMQLADTPQESGVGRWSTIQLPTFSFSEFMQIRQLKVEDLPKPKLADLFQWSRADFVKVGELARAIIPLFHDFLLRGGFPQSALVDTVALAQKLLREDIVDKILKRDMTALFGVRRVVELEKLFLYLCLHDGGEVSLPDLCRALQLPRPTVEKFIDLLESTHLIYRLMPHGYGKEILRGRPKIYLADPGIAPSVLLKGKSLLDDSAALGVAVETAFFKHVFTRYYSSSIGFSYWRGKKGHEIDIIADLGGQLIPFEVKYRSGVDAQMLRGMTEFCDLRSVERAYVVTRNMEDFGVVQLKGKTKTTPVLKIPAPLACLWI